MNQCKYSDCIMCNRKDKKCYKAYHQGRIEGAEYQKTIHTDDFNLEIHDKDIVNVILKAIVKNLKAFCKINMTNEYIKILEEQIDSDNPI